MSKSKNTSQPELFSNVHRSTVSIPVTSIQVAEGRRPLGKETLKTLVDSIATIGLQTPILVTAAPEGATQAYRLVAGHHRLEACRRLGHDRIDAIILDCRGPEDAELNEIAENVCREDLPTAEKDRLLVRLVELQKEKLAQVAPVSTGGRGKRGGERATSKALGIERTKLQRAQLTASLSPRVLAAAQDHGFSDNQSVLLKTAKIVGEDEQIRFLSDEANRRAEAKKVKSSSQARKEPSDPRTAWLEEGTEWWKRGKREWRQDFLSNAHTIPAPDGASENRPAAARQDLEEEDVPLPLDRRGERT